MKAGPPPIYPAEKPRPFSWRSLLGAWLISALIWGAVSLAFGWQMARALSLPASEILRIAGSDGLVWGLATPLVFLLTRHFPIERQRWKVALPVHAVAAVAFLLGAGWLGQTLASAHDPRRLAESHLEKQTAGSANRPPKLPKSLLGGLFVGPHLPIYLIVLSVAHALHFYQRARERETRARELAARLTEARLQALHMQIQPHFLFNSLNALGTLIHKDTAAATEMLAVLSQFLRLTLDAPAEQEVPLQRELEYAEHYLRLEKIRFGERLNYSILPEPDTLAARVPALLLQPLVENAVRHGIEPQRTPGTIGIRAWRENGALHVSVKDNGAGTRLPATEGIGLANVRARLRELYGGHASLSLGSAGSGTQVEIRLPLHFS